MTAYLHEKPVHWRYGLTLAFIFLAGLNRHFFTPWLGYEVPYATFVLPMVFAGLFLGVGPAVFAAAVGLVGGTAIGLNGSSPWVPLTFGASVYTLIALMVITSSHLVKRSHEKVKQVSQQVIKANQTKDRFLTVLGHELRNPLNSIALSSHVLTKQLQGSEFKGLRLSEVIVREAQHMKILIDQMLDISLVEQGRIQLVNEKVQVQDVVKACVESQASMMEARGQALVANLPEHPIIIEGDYHRLVQVVANLLTNARKYSGLNARIEVQLSTMGDHAVLALRDNGCGIASDKLASLFEPFVQAASSHSGPESGLSRLYRKLQRSHLSVL